VLKGAPLREAFEMDGAFAMALFIAFREWEGEKWNWTKLRWDD
jgi:hypothetical protein